MTGRGETHDRSDEEVNRVSRLPHHPRPCHSCPRFVPSLATLIPSLRSAPRRGVYDERVNERRVTGWERRDRVALASRLTPACGARMGGG